MNGHITLNMDTIFGSVLMLCTKTEQISQTTFEYHQSWRVFFLTHSVVTSSVVGLPIHTSKAVDSICTLSSETSMSNLLDYGVLGPTQPPLLTRM